MDLLRENHLELPASTVHLWYCRFDNPQLPLGELKGLLSKDEQAKAGRFKFEKDQKQSIVSRGVLRWLLGSYLKKPPNGLRFGYTEYEKPFLKGDTELRFNLSHSDEMAVFAFVQKAEIGVDIEKLKSDFNVLDIAQHFFSYDEIEALVSLPKKQLAAGFYRCWTRKESFIKAKGSGLSFPLTSFSVSLDAGHAELLRTDWNTTEKEEWQLYTFKPSQNYQVALAVRSTGHSVEEHNWNEFMTNIQNG